MGKLYGFIFIVISLFTVVGCQSKPINKDDDVILNCNFEYQLAEGDFIKINSIESPYSVINGNIETLVSPCNNNGDGVSFESSILKTHQIVISFDAVYPLDTIEIELTSDDVITIDVSTSLDNKKYINYKEIALSKVKHTLENIYARNVKLTIPTEKAFQINRISVSMGSGYRISLDEEFNESMIQKEGWTGADGIFSFNLNGNDQLNAIDPNTVFVFSDTFVGNINPDNLRRISPRLINNSFGYYNETLDDPWEFVISDNEKAVFLPDAYINHHPYQLFSPEGMSPSFNTNGIVDINTTATWLTQDKDAKIKLKFKGQTYIDSIYLWNHIDDSYQVNKIAVYEVLDGDVTFLDNTNLNPFSQNGMYSNKITIDKVVDEIIIELLETNQGEYAGLSKLFILGADLQGLFPEVDAPYINLELNAKDQSSRLWLQDGIVLNDHLYIFPILVKNDQSIFKVENVGLMEIPIINNRLYYESTNFLHTPLQVYTEDGGTIFFGAGLMDNRDKDGYIYIYGYKDLNGRHLVVARTTANDFLNFNKWTHFDGKGFVGDIHASKKLIEGVSAELSMSYMDDIFEKPYVLVSMKNTTSGTVSYALSETPYGPFDQWVDIYQTLESQYLDAFTYNAKLHYHLSSEETIYISYNVNSFSFAAFIDSRIYYPRMLRLDRISKKGD